jgi:hypothetical protein
MSASEVKTNIEKASSHSDTGIEIAAAPDGGGGVDCPTLAADRPHRKIGAGVAGVVKAHFAECFDETICLLVRGKILCFGRSEKTMRLACDAGLKRRLSAHKPCEETEDP